MNVPWELLDAHFDGEITPEQAAELSAWLAADQEHARLLVREAHLRGCLRTELASAVSASKESGLVQFPNSATDNHSRFQFSRQLVAAAASVALLLGLAFWYFASNMGEPVLAEVNGTGVFVDRGTELIPASVKMPLRRGDVLHIGTNASAAIAFRAERTTINLAAGTEFTLTSFASGKRFHLNAGKLDASVARQRPFQPMVITTPNAEARVLGTEFTLTVAPNRTRLDVTEGKVRLTSAYGASADVPAEHWAIASANYELGAMPKTGAILREYWTNIAGSYYLTFLTTNLNYPERPSGREFLKAFEMPSEWGDNFGDRFRGYLIPPRTGHYTFWIAGNDGGELRLSGDSNPENAVQIAFANGTAPSEWSKSRSQQSAAIPLVAGRSYYIEALRKCGAGNDHLAVAWQPPEGQREIIPGQYLAPIEPKPK